MSLLDTFGKKKRKIFYIPTNNSIDDEVIYRNGKINKVGNTRIHSRKPLYRILAACAAAAVLFIDIVL